MNRGDDRLCSAFNGFLQSSWSVPGSFNPEANVSGFYGSGQMNPTGRA